jgi:hypothetical protein
MAKIISEAIGLATEPLHRRLQQEHAEREQLARRLANIESELAILQSKAPSPSDSGRKGARRS